MFDDTFAKAPSTPGMYPSSRGGLVSGGSRLTDEITDVLAFMDEVQGVQGIRYEIEEIVDEAIIVGESKCVRVLRRP